MKDTSQAEETDKRKQKSPLRRRPRGDSRLKETIIRQTMNMANCFTLQLHAMTSPMHTRNVYPFMCARHHFLYRLLFFNNASSRHLLTTKQTNKSNVFSDKEKRQEIKSGHYYHRHYFCSN